MRAITGKTRMDYLNRILLGDCEEVLKALPDDSIDLIFTSPPYADQRQKTYGGISPDKYVAWFMPKAAQLQRVLKPTGTFILNIKERIVDGERHTYVLELIMKMREQGWLWTEEFMWHKKTRTLANGRIVSVTTGKGCSSLTNKKPFACIKIRSGCP
jgi:site-specific DNA-methyltransferase (adenine-specific)